MLRTGEQASDGPAVMATGYASIDVIARIERPVQPGWTGMITGIAPASTLGGCGPNVAVGLRRLGFASGVAMILGDDEEGRQYLATLDAAGIDTRYITVIPGGRTPRTYLFVPPEGPTSLFFDPGAAARPAAVPRIDFRGVRLAVLTVGPAAHNRAFAEQVLAAGLPLAWQVKGDLAAYPQPLVRELLARSHVVFMNEQESDYVISAAGVAGLAELTAHGARTVFVTRGAAGSEVLTTTARHAVPAVGSTVVDPTGAGDGFTAGALAALLRGWTPLEAARMGAAVASFVLEGWGCQARLPTWEMALQRYAAAFDAGPGGG
jgi:sugar/nucleoside kinase (ribokinase family)